MYNGSGSRFSRRLSAGIALLLALLALPHSTTFGQTALIKSVQVNQGLGNNSGKYVAGKDAAILVLLNQPTAVDATQQSVVVKLGDAAVTTLRPIPAEGQVSLLAFVCPSRPACGDWKAGNYTFDASINGNTAQTTANFQERRGLKVLAVPIKANYGPGKIVSPTDTWRGLGEFARQVYPVAPDKFEWNTGPEVDASDIKYNLIDETRDDKGETGQDRVFALITALQPRECREKPRPANAQGCYDMIIGFVKDRLGADGKTQGIAIPGAGVNVSVESDEDARGTVTHEIGHEFLLGDEYKAGSFRCDNNPPPPDYVGSDWNNAENKNFSCPQSTTVGFPEGQGSTVMAATDFPYEIGGRGLLPNMMSFMGSSSRQDQIWVSPAAWSRIFDGLAPQATGLLGGYNKMTQSDESRWIFASGIIGADDRVTLDPWESYMDTDDQEDTTGDPYTLRAVDASGNTLASTDLAVDFRVLDDKSATEKGYFEADMPFPDGTVLFQITKGDKVLSERKASDNAPTVRVTAPAAGETISSNTYTIKWEASDKDNDKLTYDVEYSTDGEEWEVLAANLDENQLTEDFSDLGGSDKANVQIRVTASDGVNSTEAESGLFSVPPKAPEVSIERPSANASYSAGSLVTLKGLAFDAQDEDITESQQLVWSSDIQGELGKGTLLNLTNLKEGKHTITLAATNSAKLTGTGTVVVNITGKAQAGQTPTVASGSTPVSSGPTAGVPVASAVPTQMGGSTTPVPGAMETSTAAPAGGEGEGATPGGMPRTGSGGSGGATDVMWLAGAFASLLLLGGTFMRRKRLTNNL